MNNNFAIISAADIPGWMADLFPVLQIIFISLLVTLSLALVLCILFQSSTSSGMGAIAGQSTETFYSKNKGKSLQGLLKRLTVIFAVSILAITVLYLIIVVIFPVVIS